MLPLVLIPALIAAGLFAATLSLRRSQAGDQIVISVPAELRRLPPDVVASARLAARPSPHLVKPGGAVFALNVEVPPTEEPAKLQA